MTTIVNIPVVGTFTYRDSAETPVRSGELIFKSVNGTVVDSEGKITIPRTISVRLTNEGTLPAGFTIPTLVGTDIYYEVTEAFSGGRGSYFIFADPTAISINLATVVPVAPPPEMLSALSAAVVASVQGFATQAEASATSASAAASAAAASAAEIVAMVPTLQSVVSTATLTPAATDDVCVVSAQAEALSVAAPLGTPTGRSTIVFKIKDNGTTRAITWNAAYVWIGTAYANTTAGKWAYVTAIYNATDSKWHLMPAQVQA